jgi:hypothetical protein
MQCTVCSMPYLLYQHAVWADVVHFSEGSAIRIQDSVPDRETETETEATGQHRVKEDQSEKGGNRENESNAKVKFEVCVVSPDWVIDVPADLQRVSLRFLPFLEERLLGYFLCCHIILIFADRERKRKRERERKGDRWS